MISSGTNTNFFKEGSSERERMKKYGSLVDELHIIVFSPKGYNSKQIADNVWIYATNSLSKFLYSFDGIRKGNPIINDGDWVITTQDPFEAGITGWVLARMHNIPLEVQVHGDIYSPHFTVGKSLNRVRRVIGTFILPCANHIRVVSDRIKHSLVKRGIKGDKIDVLPIHIDLSEYMDEEIAFNLREKYPQFNYIVLIASRLEQEKDIPTALNAFKLVHEKHNHTGLIIVGDGRDKEELKEQVKQMGLEESVIFEGWQDDLVSYYKGADVFLNTSLHEGYARTLIEAAASGIAIVSTDVGIVGDVLKQGESIEVCNVHNGACLAGKIDRLLEDGSLRSLMGEEASRFVQRHIVTEEEYLKNYKEGWERCARLWLNLTEKI